MNAELLDLKRTNALAEEQVQYYDFAVMMIVRMLSTMMMMMMTTIITMIIMISDACDDKCDIMT